MKLILSLLACACFINAATYYVSPSGSDSSNGSSSTPFRTVSHAVAVVSPGDTIILRDGTYGSEGNTYFPVVLQKDGTPSAWFTIQAEHKGKAVLDCENTGGWSQTSANGCTGYILANGGSYWKIIGVVFTRAFEAAIDITSSSNNILIQDCEFRNIGQNASPISTGFEGIYIDYADSITIDRCFFHDIGRSDGHSGDHGVYTHGTNSRITNNVFHRPIPGYELQVAPGFSGVIEGNTFAFASGSGNYGEIVLWGDLGNVTIRNNIFYNPRYSAVHNPGITYTSCTIDHNIIYGVSNTVTDSSLCSVTNTTISDPKFVNASTAPYDFHLQSTSPAIDKAVTGLGLQFDYDDNARPVGSGYDIGAYEYQGSGGSTTAATTTSIASSSNPSTYGQAVTFTATIASSSGTITGTVTFLDGANTLGTATVTGGAATLTTSALSTGTHSITARYSGDSAHAASTSAALSQTVNSPAPPPPPSPTMISTTTTLTASQNPVVNSQPVSFTATVTPATTGVGAPTGTVTFYDGGTALGSVALSGGRATFTTKLGRGTHSITASYAGDGAFSPRNSAALSETVVTRNGK